MSHKIKSICVFCGAYPGIRQEYSDAAKELAITLVNEDIHLIYGGASIGLMGILANEMLALGGKVTGVIPEKMIEREIAHTQLHQLHVVSSMHERKLLMMKLADAFIMLPGAAGSLDEFFEVMALAQLEYHDKPFGILNIANYYDSLLNFLRHAVNEGFLHRDTYGLVTVEYEPKKLLTHFLNHSRKFDSKELVMQA